MIAFAYFGGKQNLATQLIDYFPAHNHYIEPFAGSLAVLLNKPLSPIETCNDLNSDIVNFFRVLRTQPDDLILALNLTPYARQEFQECWTANSDPVEQARRFFVRVSMDIAKAGRKSDRSWSHNKKYCEGEFSYAVRNFYNKVDGLAEVSQRLRNVQIENRSAFDVIKAYDGPDSFFYLDPPYIHESRTAKKDYLYEMTNDMHIELAALLSDIKGKFMLSGYDSPLMNDLYGKNLQYESIRFKPKQVAMSRGKGRVTQEVIWINYPLHQSKKGQYSLFNSGLTAAQL